MSPAIDNEVKVSQRLHHIETQLLACYSTDIDEHDTQQRLALECGLILPVDLIAAWFDAEWTLREIEDQPYQAFTARHPELEREAMLRDQPQVSDWCVSYAGEVRDERRDALRPYAAGSL